MNEKEIVNKWFEENMCVSFDKFIENWEEQKEFANYLEQENKQLKHIIDELEKWLKKQINYLTKIDGQNIPLKDGFEFCSMNELYQTGKYSGLKDSIEKLQELKGSDN